MRPSTRRKARYLALQAVYQWQFNIDNIEKIKQQFLAQCNPKKVDTEYFIDVSTGTIKNITAIDKQLTLYLDRVITKINPVELAILRIATYELMYREDIPYKVIINEALEATKTFGAEEGFKYVNAVLDKVSKHVRKI